jgi:hypothetical protein
MFYRYSNKSEDIFQVKSIELPADLFSREEMLSMNAVDSEDDLENTLHFDVAGNLVYDGVCCCSSVTALQEYIQNNIGIGTDNSEYHVVEFDGEYIAGCSDGDVARVIEVIRSYKVSEFMKLAEDKE